MHKIISKQLLVSGVTQIDAEAGFIARQHKPGQFITVMLNSLPAPLVFTSFDTDARRGSVSLFFDDKNPAFKELSELRMGEELGFIAGPFGRPFLPEPKSSVLCVTEGLGTAGLVPFCRFLRGREVKITAMALFSTKKEMSLEARLRVSCEKVIAAAQSDRFQVESFWKNFDAQLRKPPARVYVDGPFTFIEKVCRAAGAGSAPVVANAAGACGGMIAAGIYGPLEVGGEVFYPYVDGLLLDGRAVDWPVWIKRYHRHEEQQQWLNSKSLRSRPAGEAGIFPKLLSGLTGGRR